MSSFDSTRFEHVVADLSYLAPFTGTARVRVYPPSSRRTIERLLRERQRMPIYNCRPMMSEFTLDEAGFEVCSHKTAFTDFYLSEQVEEKYYPEVAAFLKEVTGAVQVFIFDHNVRSQVRSDRGERGVREPVDGAHNDYTTSSGPRRVREILEDNNAQLLTGHRAALINVWRPIVGPVQDFPLAICDARSADLQDFVPTHIEHFLEGDLETPHLTGEVYSFRHNPAHRWFYVSDMQPDEVMLLKCYDSAGDAKACFTGHTGFRNPVCPEIFIPRESIELRTVVVFP